MESLLGVCGGQLFVVPPHRCYVSVLDSSFDVRAWMLSLCRAALCGVRAWMFSRGLWLTALFCVCAWMLHTCA